MSLPRGAVSRFVICDCGIPWLYSLAYSHVHGAKSVKSPAFAIRVHATSFLVLYTLDYDIISTHFNG